MYRKICQKSIRNTENNQMFVSCENKYWTRGGIKIIKSLFASVCRIISIIYHKCTVFEPCCLHWLTPLLSTLLYQVEIYVTVCTWQLQKFQQYVRIWSISTGLTKHRSRMSKRIYSYICRIQWASVLRQQKRSNKRR